MRTSLDTAYLPVYNGNYIVRADTGEIVNIENASNLADRGMGQSAAASASSSDLTEVELSAVSELEGVLAQDKLDATLRTVSGMGLDDGFTLNSADYSKDTESGKIFCELSYVKKISDASVIKERFPDYYSSMAKSSGIYPVYIYKYIIADAKTAELKYISSSSSIGEKQKSTLSAETLESKASNFLKNNFSTMFAKLALNKEDSDTANGRFVYSETVNGIPFPQNSISITVDTYDGTVSSLNYAWKDDVKFDAADGRRGQFGLSGLLQARASVCLHVVGRRKRSLFPDPCL